MQEPDGKENSFPMVMYQKLSQISYKFIGLETSFFLNYQKANEK